MTKPDKVYVKKYTYTLTDTEYNEIHRDIQDLQESIEKIQATLNQLIDHVP